MQNRPGFGRRMPMNALVLLNSFSSGHAEGHEAVLPYLDHLGVPNTALDLAATPLPANLGDYALLVIAHRRLDPTGARLGREGRRALLEAVRCGSGLVSFDPEFPTAAELGAVPRHGGVAEGIEFAPATHYITARHEPEERLALAGPLKVPPLAAMPGGALVTAGGRPLVAVSALGQGRAVQWATAGWMHSGVLGPLGGLDDILWRGLVWAARKPFALRGLAPLVAMRVDDVAATGGLWQRSPFYWVHEANRHGFKPWLGIFPYNLTEPAINELRDLIQRGQATAFPHAFGLWSRPGMAEVYYQGPIAAQGASIGDEFVRRHGRRPYPSDLDEFIYYDHFRGRSWPDHEAARRLAAVDEWYGAHGPLAMAKCAVPHWGEMGLNTVAHVHDRWGAEFSLMMLDADRPCRLSTPWLKVGPFRRYETPGTAIISPARRGQRPVYYADFANIGGHRFFHGYTEIRDDAGYEWRPDSDLAGTVGRGVRQLQRALDSMALPVLFTHETDHIYRISPDNWAAAIAQVARGIAGYNPIYVTLDEALRYVRATRTSRLESACYDDTTGTVSATFSGCADVATHFCLFGEAAGEIEERLVDVPAFEGEQVVAVGSCRRAN